MALVKHWLARFLEAHQAAHPDCGWPAQGSDAARRLWSAMFAACKDNKITEPEAREASRLMGADAIWSEDHPQALLEIVLANREQITKRAVEVKQHAGDRETARAASRKCPRCSGEGWTTAFHPRYDGRQVLTVEITDPDGELRRVSTPGRVSAHCDCAMGRWMRSQTDGELARRIPDVVDVLAGRSRWLLEDPTGDKPADVASWPGLEAAKRALSEAMKDTP